MVDIVEDFWINYNEYKTQIVSSILHITRRQFPNKDPQGEIEDINFVITEMYRLKIFQKWNQKRLTSPTRTKRQQFENFLYQRIWSILWNQYQRRKKNTNRYMKTPYIDSISNKGFMPKELYEDATKIMRTLQLTEEPKRKFPLHNDIKEFNGGDNYDPYEQIEKKETIKEILSICKNKNEKIIISKKNQGYTNKNISEIIGTSVSHVSNTLKKINKRYQKHIFNMV